MDKSEFPVGRLLVASLKKSFMPSKLKALLTEPNRSVVKTGPFIVQLLLLPLSSLAFPLKGHHPTMPLEGTY